MIKCALAEVIWNRYALLAAYLFFYCVVRCCLNTLSPKQLEIIHDNSSQYIVVAAGPGSGKTRAKLIQSNDGFEIYNIAEIRYFIKKIEEGLFSPIIDDKRWESAKNDLSEQYSRSECLPLCLDILNDFEKSSPRKYKTDFDMFMHESKLEDFYHAENGTVFVSTIHKAKGREFDSVYMLLNKTSADTDEERRKLYVGITRAKSSLYIHYNNNVFDGIGTDCAEKLFDSNIYTAPAEIAVQLSHRDVNLGFFAKNKNLILNMRSGMNLITTENGMSVNTKNGMKEILRYSKSFKNDKLKKLCGKGYVPAVGKIRFIVAWENKDSGEEYAVILPDLYLKKNNAKNNHVRTCKLHCVQ